MLNLAPQTRVYAGFVTYSFAMGNIFPRLADVQAGMGVTTAELGMGLIGAPIGTLLSLSFSAKLMERIGYGRALPLAIPILACLYAMAVRAPDPLTLFLLLIPTGVAIGCIELMLNAEADRTEARIGRRIMNRSHAFWSIGFFAAGLFGARIAATGISPQDHLLIVIPIVTLGALVALWGYDPSPSTDTHEAPLFALPTPGVLLIILVTVPAMLLEGASMDWSAIYMRDAFQASEFWQGIAVSSFAVLQGAMRFFADGVVERYSPAGLARVLLASLLVGCLIVVFSPFASLSLLGFALMGLGTSAIFPLAVSAAARRGDRPASVNIAAVAQFAFIMFLIGPPMLGHVAHGFGIRAAFAVGLPFVVISLLTAGALGRNR
ncbi:MFS transporter [Stagnihabitans tardus]|uniref:MFS transporter n=1 Tax=Stagnihabitans tardus TaxID=2699202 RepID=A0AAE5BT50_9RHOB|nr:MFS transporter [Stagnihabitans tardus]NBZ86241.1 MFS transporter [Stagnihabitans tardus]